jgi:hypothetical protein
MRSALGQMLQSSSSIRASAFGATLAGESSMSPFLHLELELDCRSCGATCCAGPPFYLPASLAPLTHADPG